MPTEQKLPQLWQPTSSTESVLLMLANLRFQEISTQLQLHQLSSEGLHRTAISNHLVPVRGPDATDTRIGSSDDPGRVVLAVSSQLPAGVPPGDSQGHPANDGSK